MSPWVYDPHTGGMKIPEAVKQRTRARILAHAEKTYAGKFARLDVRFKRQFCYLDAYFDRSPGPDLPEGPGGLLAPMPLVRLRYFAEDRWSLAFFTYSHERYEPSFFPSGEDHGTPEEGLDVGAVYFNG